MADNTIEYIIKATDQASAVTSQIEQKIVGSNAVIAQSFEATGTNIEKINGVLGSFGAATTDAARLQNELTQAELAAQAASANLAEAQANLAANTNPTNQEALTKAVADSQVALDGAAKKVQELNAELGGTAPKAQSALEAFTGVSDGVTKMVAGITAGLAIIKKGWDFAEEGAKIKRIQEQFSISMESMGFAADAMMVRMKAAVRGTVDDEALAQAATRAFTQGIVTDGDMMVRMLELAHAKGVLLGRDTQDIFESMIQSVDMLSTRGFKKLGINLESITVLTAEYAKAHGMAASEVDVETQKTILLNAALDKSKDAIDKANAAGDDQLTKMQRLDATLKEVGDTIAVAFADAVGPAIDALDLLMTQEQKTADLQAKHETEVRASSKTYGEYSTEIIRTGRLTGELGLAISGLESNSYELDKANGVLRAGYVEIDGIVYKASSNFTLLTAAQFNAQQGAYGVNGAMDESNRAAKRLKAEGIEPLVSAHDKLKAAEDASAASISYLNTLIAGAVGNEMTSFANKQTDLATKAAKIKDELDKLTHSQGAAIATTDKNVLSANELTAAQTKLADVTAVLGAHTQKSNESDTAFAARMAGLQVDADNLTGKITGTSNAVVKYIDNTKRINELKGAYTDINKQIDDNVAAHDRATKKILFDIAEQNAALIVDPTIRAQAMNALAAQYGLIDQKTKDSTDAIIAANTRLAEDGNMPAYLQALGDISKATLGLGTETERLPGKTIDAHAKVNKSWDAMPAHIQANIDRMAKLTGDIDLLSAKDPSGEGSGSKGQGAGPVAGLGKIVTKADETAVHVINLGDKLNALPNIERTIHYKVIIDQLPVGGGPPPAPAQHGANFIVPPNPYGGMGDYFPMLVAPGEHVQVTPAGGGQTGATTVYNTTNNIYNPAAAAMLLDAQRRAKIAHSNARMGG